jgi:hypothetical protein
MGKTIKCSLCEAVLDKNTIGLNKKFHGSRVVKFFCFNCLAIHLDISGEDLLAKIEEFKMQGCQFFE